jgi:hypothetical protein
MKFKYRMRSEFIDKLREGIKLGSGNPQQGRPIEIKLKPGGYKGKCSLIVRSNDQGEFEVVETIKHPTRFPQRIRVAAWALREERVFGRFVVEHDPDAGIVTIKRDE